MRQISIRNITLAIYLALKDKKGKELSDALTRAVSLLARKRLLARAPEILAMFQKIANEDQNILESKVFTTRSLSTQFKQAVKEFLKKRHKAQTVEITEVLDERLLGGVRIESENEVLDLSLRGKLDQLQEHLTS